MVPVQPVQVTLSIKLQLKFIYSSVEVTVFSAGCDYIRMETNRP